MSSKSKAKKINIQTTTLTDFFTIESHKNPVAPSVKPKEERSDSFYDICMSEALSRLQNEKMHANTQQSFVAAATAENTLQGDKYSTNDGTMEHEISDHEVVTTANQPSSKCTNKECMEQTCNFSLNYVIIQY